MEEAKEIKSASELRKILATLPIKNRSHRNEVVCSLIGHSRISTLCFGYRNCARCGDQLGDSLGSVDYGIKEAVVVGHNCKECKANWKDCTWKDKIFAPNPFKKAS